MIKTPSLLMSLVAVIILGILHVALPSILTTLFSPNLTPCNPQLSNYYDCQQFQQSVTQQFSANNNYFLQLVQPSLLFGIVFLVASLPLRLRQSKRKTTKINLDTELISIQNQCKFKLSIKLMIVDTSICLFHHQNYR